MSERLPDWAYTEAELVRMDDIELAHKASWLGVVECSIVWYKIYSSNGFTGKCILLGVNDIVEVCSILNHRWAGSGLKMIIGDSCIGTNLKLEALYTVLEKYRYNTKYPELDCADRVYSWQEWMKEII